MNDVQYLALSYEQCDRCESVGVCVAITTARADTVLCMYCARSDSQVEVY